MPADRPELASKLAQRKAATLLPLQMPLPLPTLYMDAAAIDAPTADGEDD